MSDNNGDNHFFTAFLIIIAFSLGWGVGVAMNNRAYIEASALSSQRVTDAENLTCSYGGTAKKFVPELELPEWCEDGGNNGR